MREDLASLSTNRPLHQATKSPSNELISCALAPTSKTVAIMLRQAAKLPTLARSNSAIPKQCGLTNADGVVTFPPINGLTLVQFSCLFICDPMLFVQFICSKSLFKCIL